MIKKLFSYICILSAILVGGMLSSCNKDELISSDLAPQIIIDNETGIFEVKVGEELPPQNLPFISCLFSCL